MKRPLAANGRQRPSAKLKMLQCWHIVRSHLLVSDYQPVWRHGDGCDMCGMYPPVMTKVEQILAGRSGMVTQYAMALLTISRGSI